MDKERLKKGICSLMNILNVSLKIFVRFRLSERKFYQKVTDLYATAFDYDKDAKTTRQFSKWYRTRCIGPYIVIRQQN